MADRSTQHTLYYGKEADSATLFNAVESLSKRPEFGSVNRFVRHCIRFTLRNDRSLERRSNRARKAATLTPVA